MTSRFPATPAMPGPPCIRGLAGAGRGASCPHRPAGGWKNRAEIKKRLDNSLVVLKTRNYDPSIVHSFLGGPKVKQLYADREINSQIYVSEKIYKLKSIETIHYQAKLLSSLQLEYQNQIDSYKNQINNLQIEYQNQNQMSL